MGKKSLFILPLVGLLAACDSGNAGFSTTMKAPENSTKVVEEAEVEESESTFTGLAFGLFGEDFAFETSLKTNLKCKMDQDGYQINVNAALDLDMTIAVYNSLSKKYQDYDIPSVMVSVDDLDLTVSVSTQDYELNVNVEDLELKAYFDAVNFMAYLDLSDESIKTTVKGLLNIFTITPMTDDQFNMIYDAVIGDGKVFVDPTVVIAMIKSMTDGGEKQTLKPMYVEAPEFDPAAIIAMLFTELDGTFYYIGKTGRAGYVVNVDQNTIGTKFKLEIPSNITFSAGLLIEAAMAYEGFALEKVEAKVKVNVAETKEVKQSFYNETILNVGFEYENIEELWDLEAKDYKVDIITNISELMNPTVQQ